MDKVTFRINGVDHTVGREVSSDVSLLEYIREKVELRGTKYMCREGGCGTCIVSVVKAAGGLPQAVNTCLVSVLSCQDWEITTIEEVGNRLKGYDPIQKTLAQNNGTQCGYCSPGWVMAMYSLLKSKPDITMLEVEKSFGSNVCRCTGYRPILEAFKKFASDAPSTIRMPDIEDLEICNKSGRICNKRERCSSIGNEWCELAADDKVIPLKDGRTWYQVHTVWDIFTILSTEGTESFMLVAGNTAKGAYPINEYPNTLIDISNVTELKEYKLDQNLVLGAGNTLSHTMDIFEQVAKEECFGYLLKLHEHISLVAHVAVRNLATVAGNLMTKHRHRDFPSDIFLLFNTVGAQLTIVCPGLIKQTVTMDQFLDLDMTGKVILNVLLPPLNDEYRLVTYKIMPKSQNAHAIVNSGFLFKLDSYNKVLNARIAYGGLSPTFDRATNTEQLLTNKDLFANVTLQNAVDCLKNELVVTQDPPEAASIAYRKKLAVNLFYKGLLELCPSSILLPQYRSGAVKLRDTRPVSQAKQVYSTDPSTWPLNQPVQKLEALIQCSGEATYTEDIPSLPREVFATFVLSTIGKGTIVSIDPTNALSEPGVVAFYAAKDIPGVNSFIPVDGVSYVFNEEVLCSGEVKFFNQPLGIIVAETRSIALMAAKLVKVTYSNVSRPVIDINAAINDTNRTMQVDAAAATDQGTDVVKIIKGSNTIRGQYHMTMETLVCVTKPIDQRLAVYSATQNMDFVQTATSRMLNIDQNKWFKSTTPSGQGYVTYYYDGWRQHMTHNLEKEFFVQNVDVYVTRLGGAFGVKVTRVLQPTMACNLVAYKLNRPCRFIQSLTDNMRTVGVRYPCTTQFEVGVDANGAIQYNNYNLYEDIGYLSGDRIPPAAAKFINNAYNKTRWSHKTFTCLTDTAKNSFIRAPGSFENVVMAEYFMEQIAYEIEQDPLAVRLANLDDSQYRYLQNMVTTLRTNAEYNSRRAEVDTFNTANRWKKRGLRFSFFKWAMEGIGRKLTVTVSIYHDDGTVAIKTGGIEMGQGVNTKAAQVAAYMFNIPLDKVKVKPTDSISAPNNSPSGASLTCHSTVMGVRKACEQLLERLEPTRTQLENPTWEELIKTAFNNGVDLQGHGFTNNDDGQTYLIHGVGLAEVEVDVLTGEYDIRRVDLLQDAGKSISPSIDIGQVEGAFMMGLGNLTMEQLVYDQTSGELLTDRTWSYYVPQARDIPQILNVQFKENSYSTEPLFGSKATGEPPMCLSVCVPLALIEALSAARRDSGVPTTTWYPVDGPFTVEKVGSSAGVIMQDFKFY